MKTLIIAICSLWTCFSYAQTGDPKVDKVLNALNKPTGKITFTMNGKTISKGASLIEDPERGLVITHIPIGNPADPLICLIAPKKKTGTYRIGNSNNSGYLQTKEKAYDIKGVIVLKVLGKKITGTFSGELYEITKKKSKTSEKSSGKISGSFTN